MSRAQFINNTLDGLFALSTYMEVIRDMTISNCTSLLKDKDLIVGKWLVAEKFGEASVAGKTRASSWTLAARKG